MVSRPGQLITTQVEQHFLAILGLALAAFAVVAVAYILTSPHVVGYEPEWIAQAVAAGHGYSFPSNRRWLFDSVEADRFFATAWADPLFTLIYAAVIAGFGDASRLVIRLANLACIVACGYLVALTGRRIAGSWAGLGALALLLVQVRREATMISAGPMATLLVSVLLYVLVRCIDRWSHRRAAVVGAVLGVAMLTWSSTMVFVPAVVLFLLWMLRDLRLVLTTSATMLLIAAAIVVPWTVRNALVFGEFVPVRNGLGQIAHMGTVGAAAMFAPEHAAAGVAAPQTKARGAVDAVQRLLELGLNGLERHRALYRWQRDWLRAQAARLDDLNEAQRDQLLREGARRFVLDNPALTAQLAVPKLAHFMGPDLKRLILMLFTLAAGLAVAFRRRLLMMPWLLVVAYVAPFAVIPPLFYRYRMPIEPAWAVLAGVVTVHLAQAASRLLLGLRVRRPPDAPWPPARMTAGG